MKTGPAFFFARNLHAWHSEDMTCQQPPTIQTLQKRASSKSPEHKDKSESAQKKKEVHLYCASCHALVTKGRWRIEMGIGHEHVFFNPAGKVFRIGCFREAPGAVAIGKPSSEFTWFRGYKWQYGLCRSCGEHLGWLFTGIGPFPAFFGLDP